MKTYLVEYYNNSLKMWGELTLMAESKEQVIQIFFNMNEDGHERSITTITEQED